jgi:hypothetical protein
LRESTIKFHPTKSDGKPDEADISGRPVAGAACTYCWLLIAGLANMFRIDLQLAQNVNPWYNTKQANISSDPKV